MLRNNITLIGNCVDDPAIKGNENKVLFLTLAVSRGFDGRDNGKKDADFIRCKAFGKVADRVERFAKRGKTIAITGTLRNQDPYLKDGITVYPDNVVVISEVAPCYEQRASEVAAEVPLY